MRLLKGFHNEAKTHKFADSQCPCEYVLRYVDFTLQSPLHDDISSLRATSDIFTSQETVASYVTRILVFHYTAKYQLNLLFQGSSF